MPATSSHQETERRLRLAETAAVLARVAIVCLLVWVAYSSTQAMRRVERSQVVLHRLELVQRDILEERANRHAYMLTEDAESRVAYAAAAQRADADLDTLRQLTQFDPLHTARIDSIRVAFRAAARLRTASLAAATRTHAETRAVLNAPDRARLRAGIARLLDRMSASERNRLAVMTAVQHRGLRVQGFCALAAVLITAIVGMTTLRYRRHRAAMLQASATTFRQLAEDNPDCVLVHRGGQLLFANAAATAELAGTRAIASLTIDDIVHPDDHELIQARTAHVLTSQTPTTPLAIRFLRHDGTVLEAEARGAPIVFDGADAIQVVLRDLTGRREAERALQLSEARFRAVLGAMAEGVVLMDETLAIRLSNPAAQQILGFTAGEMDGRTAFDPAWQAIDEHGNDLLASDHFCTIALRTARPSSGVMSITRPDTERVWISVRAVPLFQPEVSAPYAVVVTFEDITRQRQAEEELRQSHKMQVLGRMASGVAHDFNNLLTIIRSSSELLRLDVGTVPAAAQTLSDIELATDRATALTAHLLTFSRRQHIAPAVMQPAPLLRNSAALLQRMAGEQVAVELRVAPALEQEWIRADAVRLGQVLTNLVGNARDAMPRGGMLRISCDVIDVGEAITHRFGVVTPGRHVRVTVEDNGSGMTDDVLVNLFDPFFTTKPHGRGTGLGLSIVHGIVHEAQGTITVSSKPGFGSCFTVYWPTAAAPDASDPVPPARPHRTDATPGIGRGRPPRTRVAAPPAAAGPLPSPADARPTVLLVDDDESVRRVLSRQLESGGYEVRVAGGGREALDLLHAPGAAYCAMVTDVRMPGMSGIELVETMLAEHIDLPVLVVSGQMDRPLPDAWPADAAVKFLAKPISGVALRRTVESLISEHGAAAVAAGSA